MAVRREMGGDGKGVDLVAHDGSQLKIAIIHARWNETVVGALVSGCINTLVEKQNVHKDNITVYSVPGSYELQFACKSLIANAQHNKEQLDAVIAIGVLIKGSTMHFEYICDTTSHALSQVGLETGIPVIFGVLTCLTEQQALQRAGIGENSHNHGIDWAYAAVEMAQYKFDHTKIMQEQQTNGTRNASTPEPKSIDSVISHTSSSH